MLAAGGDAIKRRKWRAGREGREGREGQEGREEDRQGCGLRREVLRDHYTKNNREKHDAPYADTD
jgi:hypothetical protein